MDAVSAPNLAKVRVVLEEKGANPNWKSRGEYYVQAVPRTDDVTILGKTIDVGGSTWDNGKPTNAASVSWSVGADGALTATYRGFMHFKNFAGSGRVVLRAFDPSTGLVSAHTEGETHSSGGNGHEVSPDGNVPETLTVSSSSASSVKVVMQSWVPGPGEGGGAWQDVDSQAVSAGE
jgi:hypothetical protein